MAAKIKESGLHYLSGRDGKEMSNVRITRPATFSPGREKVRVEIVDRPHDSFDRCYFATMSDGLRSDPLVMGCHDEHVTLTGEQWADELVGKKWMA